MKNRTFSALTVAAFLAASAALVGCSKQAPEQGEQKTSAPASDVIKIGVFQPLTGANSAGGADELEGIKLANKLYPTALGKKVESLPKQKSPQ